jgi:hypothetical protein
MQDAQDSDAGMHHELPVTAEKTENARGPFGFTKHQASLMARDDIAQLLTGCLEGAKTYGVEEESFRAPH